MTTPARIERDLPAILGDLAMGPTPEYLDDVFAQTGRMRQRPGWTFPERWHPMADITSRQALAPRVPFRAIGVALVILALLVAGAVYVGSRQTKLPAPFGPAANGLIPYVSNGDLYVGDPIAGTSRLLVGGPENDGLPQTSPDGTRVAFLRSAEAAGVDPVDVYVVRDDGTDLQRITTEPLPDWKWVSWTPDGRQLAVIHPVESTGCATTVCTVNQLDLFDATGKGSVDTIASAAGMDFIQYRPTDGHEMAYRALVDGKWGLFVMDADGTDVRTLVPPTVAQHVDQSFREAVYSADGSRIFYQHGDADGCCQLWVMNADGTDQHEFLPLGPAWDGEATASPDGTRIAYWHNLNDGPAHGITVVRADGTGPVDRHGAEADGDGPLDVVPDSSKIVMFPNDVDEASAYLLDPDGGPWTTVPWESNGDLDWQRDRPLNDAAQGGRLGPDGNWEPSGPTPAP